MLAFVWCLLHWTEVLVILTMSLLRIRPCLYPLYPSQNKYLGYSKVGWFLWPPRFNLHSFPSALCPRGWPIWPTSLSSQLSGLQLGLKIRRPSKRSSEGERSIRLFILPVPFLWAHQGAQLSFLPLIPLGLQVVISLLFLEFLLYLLCSPRPQPSSNDPNLSFLLEFWLRYP